MVAAARLGARCAYAGRLGTDESSQIVAQDLGREGVDVSHAPRVREGGVVRSTIVVGTGTGSRNIFYEIRSQLGAHDSRPPVHVIQGAKVLFIDHYGMRGNLRAVHVARSAGVAVVADFEEDNVPRFRQVLNQVDHLILAEEFALRITGERSARGAAQGLWRSDRAAVIITCGHHGCWAVSKDSNGHPCHYPAFRVQAADTTGCGDVFHGAYAASLARGDPLPARIRFASAAAALKAARKEIPRLAAVEKFLNTLRSAETRRFSRPPKSWTRYSPRFP